MTVFRLRPCLITSTSCWLSLHGHGWGMWRVAIYLRQRSPLDIEAINQLPYNPMAVTSSHTINLIDYRYICCISLMQLTLLSRRSMSIFLCVSCRSRAIVANEDLRGSTPWSDLWAHDFWGTPLNHPGSHKSWRPLCVASFRLNYHLSGK